jgi:bifunctional DNase/RNase
MNCSFPQCLKPSTYYLYEISKRQLAKENVFCFEHCGHYTQTYPWKTKIGDGLEGQYEGAACFDLELIFYDAETDPGQVIYLREVGTTRLFSFFTTATAADLILNMVRGPIFSPPPPHVATVSIMRTLGGWPQGILVDAFYVDKGNPIYSCKVIMSQGERIFYETIRVSDGVGIAIAGAIPFFVLESVIGGVPQADMPG